MTTSRPRVQLLLPLRNRASFLEMYFSRGTGDGADAGGLFVPGELDVEPGDEVDVELHFIEEQVRFHTRARVKWKRNDAGRRAIPAGVGIEFLPSEQRTQQLVLRFAEGKESVHHVERERRWAVAVEVQISEPGRLIATGLTDDLSEGGCFVLTAAQLAVGASVVLKLKAPGSLFGWLTLPATVAWRRQQSGRNGLGVEFAFDTDRKRERVKRIVHLLRMRSVRDVRVQVPRQGSSPPAESGTE